MIHPSSCLFGKDEDISWLLFHEMVWTSKVTNLLLESICSHLGHSGLCALCMLRLVRLDQGPITEASRSLLSCGRF